jgi:uncharacterized protein (TIGR03118 family)
MLKHPPIDSLVKAACTIALAFAPTILHADTFTQTNLVSNVPSLAAVTDPNLINPWGLSFSATSPFWASDQGAGVATLYNGAGAITPLVVTIPAGGPPSGPTGTVFNTGPTGGFLVGTAVGATKASFIFDTLNGTIAAWNGGTIATVVATSTGAVFTGLAQDLVGSTTYLYAANSGTNGNIQVFDQNWNNVTSTTFAGQFTNPQPKSGAVPFNIQQIGANLYVTYANLGPTGNALPGGYVVEYDASGNFIQMITSGPLAAPWGITIAPANFGIYSDDLLIGQFGSGEILAYDPTSGLYLGTLDGSNGMPIVDHNLWALATRTGGTGVNLNAVYFTAGIGNQQDGLFGDITEVPEPATIFGTASGLFALAMFKIRSRLR